MAAHGSLGNECAGIIDRLLHAVGDILTVVGDVGPDVKNIGFGEQRESVDAR
jgi:hypothetical protein